MRRGWRWTGGLAAAALAWGIPLISVQPASASVALERVAGADRYATSAAVARRGWPGTADTVVVAGGRDPRDAIAAAGLAGVRGHAPVLLTAPDALPDVIRAELARLRPSTVLIVGGIAAVSSAVEGALRGLAPTVLRFAGGDVYGTAASVAIDGFGGSLPGAARRSVLVVNPDDTASGLAAGWLAAARGIPVLLAGGGLPRATADAVARLQPTTTYVIGGPTAVTDAVVASLPGGRRVAETDEYGTSVAVAQLGVGWDVNLRHVVLASGWTDAVSAAPLAGVFNAPMLLTNPRAWHGRLADWFRAVGVAGATVVGGEDAVDPFLAANIADGGQGISRGPGAVGAVVSVIQQRLLAIGFNPGPSTGQFDAHTKFAVWALQKAFGLPVNGVVGDAELAVLRAGVRPPVLRPDITAQYGDHVEISLTRQLVQVVRGGQVQWSIHTSTGKPSTPTVQGLFHIADHRPGFNAERMYMTMHFFKGYAIHGYDPVPPYAASHGSARVSYPDAELLFSVVPNGMPVIVWR